jgi:hypothetical protein
VTVATAEPVAFVLWHRPDRPRARWKKAAVVATHVEAVARIAAGGDWWIAPIINPELLAAAGGADHAEERR